MLKNQVKETLGGVNFSFDNSLFSNLTDKELLSIKVMSDIIKLDDKAQEKDVDAILKQNNLTKLDIQNASNKLADLIKKIVKK